MKELDINELLNSFIDGELSERQKTEVQRLAAHNPEIAKHLQQLQKCRMLVASLPYEQAPIDMAEQVKITMERKALLAEQPFVIEERKGARHLMFRKVLAAADMFALVAVLASVVYIIVTPEHAQPAMSFVGRLELETNNLLIVDELIDRAIKDNGLAHSITQKRQRDQNIYTLSCSRENLSLFLADLENSWDNFSSAALFVETQTPQEPVVINDVDAGKIVNLITPPKPKLTAEEKTSVEQPARAQMEKKVRLTIVVKASKADD
jgi:hypothetical protein